MIDLILPFKSYLATKTKTSPITVKNYVSDLNKFLKWFELSYKKPFEPADLTAEVINNFSSPTGLYPRIEANNSQLSPQNASPRSLERYASTLRRFAQFLTEKKFIASNPFVELSSLNSHLSSLKDPWKIKAFKNYLYLDDASKFTIKNYAVDINAFTSWLEQNTQIPDNSANHIELINNRLTDTYRGYLSAVLNLSPKSVNRKMSSIRKYLRFAVKEGLIKAETEESISRTDSGILLQDENPPATLELADLHSENEIEETTYSSFPPVRLTQKLLLPYVFVENAVAGKIAESIKKARLEAKANRETGSSQLTEELSSSNRAISDPILPGVTYAETRAITLPLSDSSPWHKKLIHHARFTRPDWYKTYHNNAAAHYFHFAILVVYASVLGIIIYHNMFENISGRKVLASSVNPPRILSFQGILTDNNGSPITSSTNIRFIIYNSLTATGSALLWQEARAVTPDSNGVFQVLLGNSTTTIPESLFAEHNALYLGVTINQTSELTPRQRLATVPYAANSETLQGMLPVTDGSAGTSNVILALDSSGNLTIGGSAAPTFTASGGQFKLSGQPLVLASNTGSNGNVKITPDGFGRIDLEAPLINNSASGLISPGGVEIQDKASVLATESAVAAFIINNNTTGGDIFAASSSGTTRFVLGNTGDISLQSGISIDTLSTGTISIGGTNTTTMTLGRIGQGITLPGFTEQNGVLYGTYGTGELAQTTTTTTGLCLVSAAQNPAWSTCSGTDSFWNQSSGALYPNNSTSDFMIGGQATTSAKFAIINVLGSGPVTATVAGNLIVMPVNGVGGTVGIGMADPTHALELGTDDAAKPGTTTWTVTSDARTKTDVNPFADGLNIINKINPVTFTYNGLGGTVSGLKGIGVIAQDVQGVAPYMIGTFNAKLNPGDKETTTLLDFNPHALFFLTINALKELDAKMSTLSSEISTNIINAGTITANAISGTTARFGSITADSASVLGNLSVNALAVTTDSVTVAGQSLSDYIQTVVSETIHNSSLIIPDSEIVSPLASIDEIHTNIISPLADSNEVHINGKLVIARNANDETISSNSALLDIQGSASIAGTLTANTISANQLQIRGNLSASDATLSGTLYANNIQANSIEGLDDRIKNLVDERADISTISAQTISANHEQLATAIVGTSSAIFNNQQPASPVFDGSIIYNQLLDVRTISSDFGTFREGLIALGPATFADAAVLNNLTISNNLTIGGNSIDALSDLEIQPLKQGAVSFLAGRVRIETDGTLKVTGNAEFGQDVTVHGALKTNIISPLADRSLVIASPAGRDAAISNSSNLLDVRGSIAASGSGTFSKLNLSLIEPAYAISDTEVVATSSAGTATIKTYRTELTIDNPNVTDKSLIYVTPVGRSNNQVPYLLRQLPQESFTVGLDKPALSDLQFNWIIVN